MRLFNDMRVGVAVVLIMALCLLLICNVIALPPAPVQQLTWQASIIVASSNACNVTGAKYFCDGVDDQEEINAAIQELVVTCGTAGEVLLTEGPFNIASEYQVGATAVYAAIRLYDDITLRGSGGSTKIIWKENTDNFIAISNDSHITAGVDTDYRMFVRDLMLDGDDKGYGIYFEDAFDSTVENVWVTDAAYGVYFDDVDRSNVLTSSIYSCFDGFSALNCDKVALNGCYIYSMGNNGGYFSTSTNCALEGNQVYSCGNYALYFVNGSHYPSLVRNTVSNSLIGIYIISSSYGLLANNIVYDTTGTGIALLGMMGQPNCDANEVVGNQVSNTGTSGEAGAYGIALTNFIGTIRDNSVSANHVWIPSTGSNAVICIYSFGVTNTVIEGNVAMNRRNTFNELSGGTRVRDNVGLDAALAAEWLAETSPTAEPSLNYKVRVIDSQMFFYDQYIDIVMEEEAVLKFAEYLRDKALFLEVEWIPGMVGKGVRVCVLNRIWPLQDVLKVLTEATGINPKDLTKNMGNYIKPSDVAWGNAGLRTNIAELNGRVGTAEVAYYYLEHPDKYPYTTQDIKDYIDQSGWKSLEVLP